VSGPVKLAQTKPHAMVLCPPSIQCPEDGCPHAIARRCEACGLSRCESHAPSHCPSWSCRDAKLANEIVRAKAERVGATLH